MCVVNLKHVLLRKHFLARIIIYSQISNIKTFDVIIAMTNSNMGNILCVKRGRTRRIQPQQINTQDISNESLSLMSLPSTLLSGMITDDLSSFSEGQFLSSQRRNTTHLYLERLTMFEDTTQLSELPSEVRWWQAESATEEFLPQHDLLRSRLRINDESSNETQTEYDSKITLKQVADRISTIIEKATTIKDFFGNSEIRWVVEDKYAVESESLRCLAKCADCGYTCDMVVYYIHDIRTGWIVICPAILLHKMIVHNKPSVSLKGLGNCIIDLPLVTEMFDLQPEGV